MCDKLKLEAFKRKILSCASATAVWCCVAAVAAEVLAQGREIEPAGRSLSMLLAGVWRYVKLLVSVSALAAMPSEKLLLGHCLITVLCENLMM